MSLGAATKSAAMVTAVTNTVIANIVMGVAAGNSNADACSHTPSEAEPAITVGSTTISDGRSSFSNYGTCVHVSAPGSGILSTFPPDGTKTLSGTSMASPREYFERTSPSFVSSHYSSPEILSYLLALFDDIY